MEMLIFLAVYILVALFYVCVFGGGCFLIKAIANGSAPDELTERETWAVAVLTLVASFVTMH